MNLGPSSYKKKKMKKAEEEKKQKHQFKSYALHLTSFKLFLTSSSGSLSYSNMAVKIVTMCD